MHIYIYIYIHTYIYIYIYIIHTHGAVLIGSCYIMPQYSYKTAVPVIMQVGSVLQV
jgi:hypothetical protein